MNRLIWFSALGLIFFSCNDHTPPTAAFEAYAHPAAPDYSQLDHWAAHPAKKDSADGAPKGVTPGNQAEAKADVFFIHPTMAMGGDAWNAPLTENEELANAVDNLSIRHQASVYNQAGRIFAPRYRQMYMGGFFSPDTASERKALQLAYADVRAAFQHYLTHENKGRPILIASHSQGAWHAMWLLEEFFDGKPLQSQLVAAYIVGWPFKASRFKAIPVCDTPDQTGCVLGWNTWREGVIPDNFNTYYKDAVAVNPISWRRDTLLAPESAHKGFLWRDYEKMRSQSLHAQVKGGIVWVKRPLKISPIKNYHIGDYNLFWLDIRQNALERVEQFE
jgi:hypothetical protein